MTRHAKRVDENHKSVVEEIRQALPDATVLDLSGTGKGCPDIMVGWHELNFLFEIKNGEQIPSKRRMTAAQVTFHENWQGQATLIHTAAEAIAEIARYAIGAK